MALAGINKIYAARLITDATTGLVFDTPRYLSLGQEISIKPKYNSDSAYAENRQCDTGSELDSVDLGLNRYDMRSDEEAWILGRDADSNGGVIGAAGDDPPYLALLYRCPLRRKKSNGVRATRHGIIYKAQFTPPDIDAKTTEGKPDFSQTPQLAGTAIATDWFYKNAQGLEKHPWEYHVDDDDPSCPDDIADTFFNGVHIPGVTVLTPLSLSSVPVAGAESVAVGTDPALTFSEQVGNYSGISIMKADGTAVEFALSVDSSGKIVTITPGAALSAATEYIIVVAGVTDIYGRQLAPQVIKFTTAS